MAMINQYSGCKVGWETYDTLAEAEAASERARSEANRKAAHGYDFGYLSPGSIEHHEMHPRHGVECWTVTTP